MDAVSVMKFFAGTAFFVCFRAFFMFSAEKIVCWVKLCYHEYRV